LLLVSCMTNGEQKQVVLLHGSSGVEGPRSPPGQHGSLGAFDDRSVSPLLDGAADNDAPHTTGHAMTRNSIRNEVGFLDMLPKSIVRVWEDQQHEYPLCAASPRAGRTSAYVTPTAGHAVWGADLSQKLTRYRALQELSNGCGRSRIRLVVCFRGIERHCAKRDGCTTLTISLQQRLDK